jgi:hypothetical protein
MFLAHVAIESLQNLGLSRTWLAENLHALRADPFTLCRSYITLDPISCRHSSFESLS